MKQKVEIADACAAWTVADLEGDRSWVYTLDDMARAALGMSVGA